MSAPGFANRCRKLLNHGRHVCLFTAGHAGQCHPHVNAPFPPVDPVTQAELAAIRRVMLDAAAASQPPVEDRTQ